MSLIFFRLVMLNSLLLFLLSKQYVLLTALQGSGVLLIASRALLPLAVLVNRHSEIRAWIRIFPRSGFSVLGVACLGIRNAAYCSYYC